MLLFLGGSGGEVRYGSVSGFVFPIGNGGKEEEEEEMEKEEVMNTAKGSHWIPGSWERVSNVEDAGKNPGPEITNPWRRGYRRRSFAFPSFFPNFLSSFRFFLFSFFFASFLAFSGATLLLFGWMLPNNKIKKIKKKDKKERKKSR